MLPATGLGQSLFDVFGAILRRLVYYKDTPRHRVSNAARFRRNFMISATPCYFHRQVGGQKIEDTMLGDDDAARRRRSFI